MNSAARVQNHIAEQLEERRYYRQVLINRRNEYDAKIARVEAQIKKLGEGKLQGGAA